MNATHQSELVPTIPRPGCVVGVTLKVLTLGDGRIQVMVAGAHAEMTADSAERLARELLFAAELSRQS